MNCTCVKTTNILQWLNVQRLNAPSSSLFCLWERTYFSLVLLNLYSLCKYFLSGSSVSNSKTVLMKQTPDGPAGFLTSYLHLRAKHRRTYLSVFVCISWCIKVCLFVSLFVFLLFCLEAVSNTPVEIVHEVNICSHGTMFMVFYRCRYTVV